MKTCSQVIANIQQSSKAPIISAISTYCSELIMDSNCHQCTRPIKTVELILCSGFCKQAAHFKCVGLQRPCIDVVNENTNVLWFCDNCMTKLESIREDTIKSVGDVVSAVSDAVRESLDEIKVELQETKELTKALVEKRQSYDSSDLGRGRTAWPSIKRTRDIAAKGTPKSRPDLKLLGGTKSVEKGSLTVDTVAKPSEKFWLYLSRIAPHVTEDDISELVKNCLQTQQPIEVRKLVKKDANLKQFAFISFKIGVEKELKETALNPSVWPKGIYFREFENLQTERVFWGPSKYPRMDVGTPTPTPITPSVEVISME